MLTIADLCTFLDAFAPPHLAAEWDNVGLLVGDRGQAVERVMTCLTITSATAAEAVRERANLVVTHHPLPFRPIKRLTADEPAGRSTWLTEEAIRATAKGLPQVQSAESMEAAPRGTLIIGHLKEPANAILVEFHQVFVEPKKWFDGANLLRSKLPLVIQPEVRAFRRELTKLSN